MQKGKSFVSGIMLLLLALLIFTNCQVSNLAEPEGAALKAEMTEEGVGRPPIPVSKTVTQYKEITQTLHGSEIVMKLGCPDPSYKSIKYNDGTYSGVVPQTSYTILEYNELPNGYYYFRVKITYSGKVYIAASKEVTHSISMTQYAYDYEIVSKIGNPGPAYNSYYYNDGTYKGSIPKVGGQTLSYKLLYDNYYEFQVELHYKGTVYR